MDKISGLPDELLVKILSLLPTKVAISTSILSKRWQFLWMWLPKLDYGYPPDSSGSWRDEPPRDFVFKNFPLHKAPVLESVRLVFTRQDITPQDIKLWVEIAVSRHVRELEISHVSDEYENKNLLPSSLFTCESLVILKLDEVTLTNVPSVVAFPSLKTLQLKDLLYTDDKSLGELLSICPVLEDLDLSFCDSGIMRSMKEFAVIVPSLQKLSLFIPGNWYLRGYEIDTPSLKYFKLESQNYCRLYSSSILFRNMPKLEEAYIDAEHLDLKCFVGSITSVKHLTLCCEYENNGDGFVFNNLEHLEVCVCKRYLSNLLFQFLNASPSLRELNIFVEHCVNDDQNGMVWNEPSDVPECMLSSLQVFKWSQYFGRPQDRDLASYILKNARHLKKATFLADTMKYDVPNLKMIKELALSSRASDKCELVFVEDRSDDSSSD